ncbi:beta-lactamase [Polymorphobacter multimanifer]|uniref:Beta-lactamase n=1 Tax=Polymorphobacter multimanifer TaxID=1070431 RepID=A0A841L5E4_9SPHN|nr:class A beta-lactamase [Polymorphobacter multimanifer]MBB6227837.1 beta-lactamase class A [Polymorphobacter multimanifer]GGI77356.1 beta-lactamase [Polymorphobacter multimanifer]
MLPSRRAVLPLPLLALLPAAASPPSFAPIAAALAATERATGGRCGLALLDTATSQRFTIRGDERFAMCSTFKLALAAQLLDSKFDLQTTVPITAEDMVSHAPFTQPRIGTSASLFDLAAAMMITSDNPATNLVLRRLGGPAAFTAWVRGQGDRVTRLDRYETMMSEGTPGDPRDTTSPSAMLGLVHRLLFGDALAARNRQQLIAWMHASETGDTMLRAGLPGGWTEGNKTGAGDHGIRNTVSIVTPPGRPPLLLSIYMAGVGTTQPERNAHYPPIARALVESLAI